MHPGGGGGGRRLLVKMQITFSSFQILVVYRQNSIQKGASGSVGGLHFIGVIGHVVPLAHVPGGMSRQGGHLPPDVGVLMLPLLSALPRQLVPFSECSQTSAKHHLRASACLTQVALLYTSLTACVRRLASTSTTTVIGLSLLYMDTIGPLYKSTQSRISLVKLRCVAWHQKNCSIHL